MITTQPQSQTVTQGVSVTFMVGVSSLTYPTYQWRFSGANIANATNSYYTIGSPQLTNTGDYSVAVTNSVGWVISSNASLTVLAPPSINVQPTNFNRFEGGNVTFSVSATGTAPLTYQWRFNSTTVASGTNSSLPLVNVQAWQAGSYSVAISNAYGYAVSTNGILTVIYSAGTVACWGNNAESECTLPPGTSSGYKAIAAGGTHSLALRTNGTVFSWGGNTYGQTNVPTGLSNVVAIAAGYYHSLALLNDGSVMAWGFDGFGEIEVPPGLTNAIKIAAGAHHNIALLSDATVTAWGDNTYGQTNVPAGLSNVVLIAAGYYHNLALTSDGAVVGWGSNAYGETLPPTTLTGVVGLSAGNGFSLALKSNGNVVAWGDNTYGQTNVPSPLTTATAISAGGYHSLALKNNGTVVAWGQDNYGETNVPSGITAMVAVSAGAYHNLVLKGSGAPVVTAQPFSHHVNPGTTASLNVMAVGNGALGYQWYLNGTELAGATKNNFTRTNAQPPDGGNYSVIVSNALGTVVSSNAVLTIGDGLYLASGGFSSSGFQIQITGPGGVYLLEASNDLTNWTTIDSTNAPPGTVILTDPAAFSVPSQFYRAFQQ